MIYNLNLLNNHNKIEINEKVIIDDKIDKRIHDLVNAKVLGNIYLDSLGNTILKCIFTGTMYICDSITLEDIPYDFKIDIEENIEDLEEIYVNSYFLDKNTLDLKEILWQNIVLEVPISYTLVKDANIKGNGWELLKGEKKLDKDPRLEKLEDLLKGDD